MKNPIFHFKISYFLVVGFFLASIFFVLFHNSPLVQADACYTPTGSDFTEGINVTNDLTLCSGTYDFSSLISSRNALNITQSGAADNPLTLTCQDNTVLDGGDLSGLTGIRIENSQHIEIKNCTLRNFDTNISIRAAGSISISNNTLESANMRDLDSENSNNLIISSNTISNDYPAPGSAEACIWLANGGNYTVENNTIFNCYNKGICLDQATNSLVSHNDVSNTGTQGIVLTNSRDNVISDNRIYGHKENGIRIFANSMIPLGGNNANNTIINNVIYDNQRNGIEVLGDLEDGLTNYDNTFVNNTIQGNAQNGFQFMENQAGSTNFIKNNIIVDNGRTGIWVEDKDESQVQETYNNFYNNTFGSYYGFEGSKTDISVDPQFVSPATHDYHLKSQAGHWTSTGWVQDETTSPCIDAGDPKDDYSQEPEPNGGRVDLGNYGNTTEASLSSTTGCVVPTSGMTITHDTIFCAGAYHVEGIQIRASGTIEEPLAISCELNTVFDGFFLGTDPDSSASYAQVALSLPDFRGEGGSGGGEYVTISGCKFKNYHKAIQGGRHVKYENNEFENIIRHSIMVQEYGEVVNNYFHGFLQPADYHESHSAISFFGSHSVLANNLFAETQGMLVFETFLDPLGDCPQKLDDFTIRNNIINGQKSDFYFQCVQNVQVENNLLYGNDQEGSAIDLRWTDNVLIKNNTIVNNSGVGLFNNMNSNNINFKNNIIAFNRAGIFNDPAVTFAYNDSYGNTEFDYRDLDPNIGHNISVDPQFVSVANHDYHLKSKAGHWTSSGWIHDEIASPCIDAGDPKDDYSQEPEPNGGRIDLGSYGNTSEASLSPGCKEPYNGMKIGENTVLCTGDYAATETKGLWEPYLEVIADNITITCLGTTMTGKNQQGIGLKNNGHSGVTITNNPEAPESNGCTFYNFNFGMVLREASGNHLVNLNLYNNKRGVQIAQSSKDHPVRIEDSKIQDNSLVDLAVYRSKVSIDHYTASYCEDRFVLGGKIVVEE